MQSQGMIGENGVVFQDKVQKSIERLKAFEPEDCYFLAFSGGKDSIVIKELAKMSGVKYEAHYSVTTVDPPELIYYMREHHKDVIFDYPKKTMWQLIIEQGVPPTRLMRYCCAKLKEGGGKGKIVITGVRWAESANRKTNKGVVNIGNTKKTNVIYNDENHETRRTVENCYRTRKALVNPIIDWTDADVWAFIKERNLPYCKLYDEGFKRLGCIGCPMGGGNHQKKQFERYPTYKQAYLRAFEHMIKKREQKGAQITHAFSTAQTCFDWWIGDLTYPPENQILIDEMYEELED